MFTTVNFEQNSARAARYFREGRDLSERQQTIDLIEQMADADYLDDEIRGAVQRMVELFRDLIASEDEGEIYIKPVPIHALASYLSHCNEVAEENIQEARRLSRLLLPAPAPAQLHDHMLESGITDVVSEHCIDHSGCETRTIKPITYANGYDRSYHLEFVPNGTSKERANAITDIYSAEHQILNEQEIDNLIDLLIESGSAGKVIEVTGAMMSGKSTLIIQLIKRLTEGAEPLMRNEEICMYTAAALGESVVKSRVLGVRVPVNQLTLSGLEQVAVQDECPKLMIVDEAFFLQFPGATEDDRGLSMEERIERIIYCLQALKNRGTVVMLVGIDSNILTKEFDLYTGINGFADAEIRTYSFAASIEEDGEYHIMQNVNRSLRYIRGGVIDLGFLPIPISEEEGIVTYGAVADYNHPVSVIAEFDPELHQHLRDQFGHDMAKQIYIEKWLNR